MWAHVSSTVCACQRQQQQSIRGSSGAGTTLQWHRTQAVLPLHTAMLLPWQSSHAQRSSHRYTAWQACRPRPMPAGKTPLSPSCIPFHTSLDKTKLPSEQSSTHLLLSHAALPPGPLAAHSGPHIAHPHSAVDRPLAGGGQCGGQQGVIAQPCNRRGASRK